MNFTYPTTSPSRSISPYTSSQPISPFDNNANNPIVSVYLEPILNTLTKKYQKIITFSGMPTGPLSNMVTKIQAKKLSDFQQTDETIHNSCKYVLCRYPPNTNYSLLKHESFYMGANDIPSFISYLESNGYTILHHTTDIMLKTNVIDNKQVLFLVGKPTVSPTTPSLN
jgi:hypothetical protein